MTNSILYYSVFISLLVQFSTLLLDLYAVNLEYKPEDMILQGLIGIEIFVQFIEVIFYLWLYNNFTTATNITSKRYYDWVFTTPAMLFVLIVYLDYMNNKHVIAKKDESAINVLYETFIRNSENWVYIASMNFMMLFFGYLGATGIINKYITTTLGFGFFSAYFYFIYENYAKYSSNSRILFYMFTALWSLYGINTLNPYIIKNVNYNILDIFSKNFFGIYLAIIAILKND
jgi:uncharacterized membrane protein